MTYKVAAVDLSTVSLNEAETVASVLQNIAIILSTRQVLYTILFGKENRRSLW